MTMDKFLGLAMCSDYFFSFFGLQDPRLPAQVPAVNKFVEDDVIHDLPSCRNFQKGNLIGEQSKDSGPKIVSRSFRFDSCERLWVLISLLCSCIASTQRCSQPHR